MFDLTVSNVVLFASVGASAVILTHSTSHHLTKLHTTIVAYVLAIVISYSIFLINQIVPLHIAFNMFLVVFTVAFGLYYFDTFHPPAITAALSFILVEGSIVDLMFLFCAIIVLLVFIRLVTYIFSQNMSLKKFRREFSRNFHHK